MISLHTHSTFSLLDGYGTPKQIIDKCKSLGNKAIALTDHGVINGYVQFEQAAKQEGIKPIFGCEFYLTGSIKENQRHKHHITVIAQNLEGYRNILALVSKSFQEGFYYRQTIDFDMLKRHKKGLIILSGCLTSPSSYYILNNQFDSAEKVISWCKAEFGSNFFLETQLFNLEDSMKVNTFLNSIKEKYSSQIVMTNDVHYLNPDEQRVQDVLYAIRNRDLLANTKGKMTGQMYQMNYQEAMSISMKYHPDIDYVGALQHTYDIANMIEEYPMPKAPFAKFNDMSVEDKKQYMMERIIDGWKLRNINSFPNKDVYRERMKYEFDIIFKKNFMDYFLIVADMVVWAKSQGILCGPARGSAAGSLVCYLMRITEVDPIVHGLIFERFIDITREDMPDIDLDFEDEKRDQVKSYLINKYGEDRVANIIAYSAFKGKSIIDDLTRVYNLPAKETIIIKQLLLQRSGGDARADMTMEDTFNEFPQAKEIQERYPEAMSIAPKLEGQYRQLTVHAAGVIVGGDSLKNYTAFMRDNSISYDHHDATYLNLLKIDVLGLKTLRIIRQIMDKVGMKDEDLYSLPLDDEKVYDKFNTYQYVGVFQFGGDAINNICRQMKFNQFSDITEANALARPGALHCGTATAYFQNNRINIHPLVNDIANDANGQILYQEQVMRIMREIGLMSWKDTAEIRKLISKSQGVEKFNTFKEKFTKGALSQGMSIDMINDIWAKVCTFGSWAFNKSHSVSYALLAYWTMWFKVYHPLEFYWSNLTADFDDINIVKEAYDNGIKFLPFDAIKSQANWIIEDEQVRQGFITLKGIGEKTASALQAGKQKMTKKIVDLFEKENQFIEENGISELLYEALMFPKILKEIKGWTHKINDLSFGPAHEAIVAGRIKERNLRSLKEVGQSKTGTLYDKVWHEEWDKWVNLEFFDDTGIVIATVPRQLYNTSDYIKDQLWNDFLEDDIYVIKGQKTKDFRKITVWQLYNLSRKEREDAKKN